MGCFSFLCKNSGKPVASDSSTGDAVRLYLLKGGKVIEEMRGHYDSYGRVFDKDGGSFKWNMDWSDVCDLMFSSNKGNGIAAVLECYFDGVIPSERSSSDPDQGWGKKNGKKVKILDPIHIGVAHMRESKLNVILDK